MRGYSQLQLGADLGDLTVLPHPGATLLSLIADVFADRRQGVPPRWRSLISSATSSPEAVETLRPLFNPQCPDIPDCLTPTASMPERGVDPDPATYLDYLADVSPETLLSEVEAQFAGTVPPQWCSVVDRPSEWIRAYVRLMRTVWDAFEPIWRAAAPGIARETERVGTAVVRGLPEVALAGIANRIRFAGSALYLPDPAPQAIELARRRLILVPLVAGTRSCAFTLDHSDLAWVGYSLPGLGDLDTDSTVSRSGTGRDALSTTIGSARAALLRAVDRPRQMGELAALLGCSPSTLTHHCIQLETAGLLHRRRRGREVRLTRTERADALLDLLS